MKQGQDTPEIWHELEGLRTEFDALHVEFDATCGYDAEGAWRYCLINGVKTKVYTKYLTGTTGAAASNNYAHGIAGGMDKILHLSICLYNTTYSAYYTGEIFMSAWAAGQAEWKYDSTWVQLYNVGASSQSQKYRFKLDYIL